MRDAAVGFRGVRGNVNRGLAPRAVAEILLDEVRNRRVANTGTHDPCWRHSPGPVADRGGDFLLATGDNILCRLTFPVAWCADPNAGAFLRSGICGRPLMVFRILGRRLATRQIEPQEPRRPREQGARKDPGLGHEK